ncbi:DNA-3-methyladenine glycosylase I [Lacticaseibacillus camelliae]|uniref:3-methyladenine DNA glycosylase n=1 Tax=Lacticaseibacillus camelliae DSM 22697 = JCM 13995 TaxID=1423730 RepID=A0A0R2F4M2_9LACO|nr:DNA-3-methyladenine glycosylase I [Lacticaseibacillus camelliae]KRN23352.1 3-methyladenine DNA glycosylase [Lacticaseibacillus camelliae DSM 22697 = JCM 13995]
MEESVWWAKSPVLKDYHDHEWGVPKHNERQLFELLSLESLQIGLNWELVLNKRAAFNEVFHDFDIEAVAHMTDADILPLMADARLIRNRRKLASIPHNARAVQQIQQEFGSFAAYVWHFTDGKQLVNKPRRWADVPAYTDLSTAVAKDMKKRGITMIGPTTAYSFLQGAGVIDDHLA